MTAKEDRDFVKQCDEVVKFIEWEGETQLASILRERLRTFRERHDALKTDDPGDQE